MSRKSWTCDQLALLGRLYPCTSTEECAKQLGMTVELVYRKAMFLGLRKTSEYLAQLKTETAKQLAELGKAHRFQKGSVPANKGVKGINYEGCKVTQFKKGNRPHTWVPVGSYRVNGDGYLELKFSDEPGPYTLRWVPVHRLIWVEANGPVPAGHAIAFKAGRATTKLADITLDAIECVSRAEMLRRNNINNHPPEIAEVMRMRGYLTRAINKRAKEKS